MFRGKRQNSKGDLRRVRSRLDFLAADTKALKYSA